MPTARAYAAAATAANGRVYVFGGLDAGQVVEGFDPEANTWSSATRMPTGRSRHAAAVGPDGLIYVVGGMLSNTGFATATAKVEVFAPSL